MNQGRNLFASERSRGEKLSCKGEEYTLEVLDGADVSGINIALKLDFINQQSDDCIVHPFQLREANGSSCQTFNPCSKVQVFAFNFLCIALTNPMLTGVV